MRAIDDPRVAAELFCDQHGITDGKIVGHLEETLRDLIYPRPSPESSMGNRAQPSFHPTSEPRPSPSPSLPQPTSPPINGRASAGVSPRPAVEAHNTDVRRENAAVGEPKTPSAGVNVMEVARAMRDAAMASMDAADPGLVVVDLVVNGVPAPLVFRDPRRKLAARRNRDDHGHPGCDREKTQTLGKQGGSAGGEKSNAGVEGEGQDVEEDRERAIAAAAVAWCRRFGSARVEDISFVRAEIRKAVAAREKAAAGKVDPGAAAAAAGGGTGKDAAAAPTPAEGNDAPSSKGRTGDGHPKYVVASKPRRKEGEKGGAAGGHGEHVTISSVLAPDVVKGTSIFWVQVEPGLPVVYVLAGYSALEISQQFCRSHKLGPSQVPLVAWKLLEAYPVQMEAARRDGTPLPAKVTLEYATCQPEAQASHLVLAGGRSRSRRRAAPAAVSAPRAETGLTLVFSAFRGWLFLWWRWTKLQAEDQRESMEDTTVVSSPAPGGDSGARLAPKSRGVGDLFSPSSVMRRLFGRAKGTATAEQAAEGHAGKARQDPPAAASSRTNRKPVDNENTVGPLEGRTTPVAEKGGGDGNKTTLRGGPPALSRLRSWADAFSFECGRLVGAAVRKAVVLPLMRVFGGGAERNAGDETTSAAAAIAASPWPRKRKQSASTARARSRKGRGSFHGGLGVSSNRSEPAKKPQSGASKGPGDCSTPRAAENEETRGRYERESSGRGEGRAPFSAGRSDQRGTWASVLDGLARDPLNRFSEVALLSKVGHILAKTDAFAIEAHESCDWTRLFKSKKSDIIVGRQKFLVLSRNEGSIIVANKALGTKMIGRKTRAGTVVLGAYTDHSKSEAREGVAWLAEALASSRVR
ncbi:unnamed protein product [Scytosiphon promiscuus]